MEQNEVIRLFETYSDDVFRLALSYLQNRHDAEDICQVIFMKLMNHKKPLDPSKEKSWLLTCTVNACKDHLKSFWRKNTVSLEDAILFTRDTEKELWDALNSLAPKYRIVVHLYYYEGYAQDEIAKILNISRTAVQTRMSRARNQLKEVLTEYE